MADPDARVRANFVEGLWNGAATDHHRRLFRRALEDSNHRVVGNALVGLHRLGEHRDVVKQVSKMARRPEAAFRATAAWVMGRSGEELYASVLRHMVRDPDLQVRRSALRSLRQINMGIAASPGREAQLDAEAS
jgi:HEAT repeat protein